MQADPALTDEYVPPGLVYKFSLFLALAAGAALIVPVHMLTAKKAAAEDGPSLAVTFPDGGPAKSYGPIQIASAAPSQSFGNPFQGALPSETLPLEPAPLEALPLEPMTEEHAVSLEPVPYELTPQAEGSNGALRQPPAIDEEFVFQPAPPVEEAPAVDPVPAPPVAASEPVKPMPAVAVEPPESPSDVEAMPMPAPIPAVAETEPAQVVESSPGPVVDMAPVDVAPIPEKRGITCTSPVPEPVVLRATSSQPPQLPQAYGGPTAQPSYAAQPSYGSQPSYPGQQTYGAQQGYGAQPGYAGQQTQATPPQAAQPRPQVYRPAAPQPQPAPRQTFNHPGYGASNYGISR